MPRAVVLGGTGATGRATTRRLLAAGWSVQFTGRDASRAPGELTDAGARFARFERSMRFDVAAGTLELATVLGDGADLVVDCTCYTADHARTMLPLLESIGSVVMISSKAVYADSYGNHSNSDVRPWFDGPVTEQQPTLAPRDGNYNSRGGYGPNKVAAERVLLDSGAPVSVLRPSKIHGIGASNPREWFFVRRVLDGREVVLLADHGSGIDHTSAATNIAALIETVAPLTGSRILNIADPDAADVRHIAMTVAAHFGHRWSEVLVDGPADNMLGWTPWNTIPPVILDTSAAVALGYRPVGSYGETVGEELDWLASREGELRADVTELSDPALFDYAAEDAYLENLSR